MSFQEPTIADFERLTSFGANLPFIIHEADCDDMLPLPIHDRHVGSQSAPHAHDAQDYPLVLLAQVTKLFFGVQQTLKSNRVSVGELRTHEEQFRAVLLQLPEPLRQDSGTGLEPSALSAVMMVHLARFQLYRRNLSPVCPLEERTEALNNCANVARDTARAVQRTLRASDSDGECMRRIASNIVCIHLWRCTLMLCLQRDYQSALVCARASAAVGEARKVNKACGKNLLFFLEQMAGRNRRGDGNSNSNTYHAVDDEEMFAYASGDLQSELEHPWAWAGTGTGDRAPSSASMTRHPDEQTYGKHEATQDGLAFQTQPNSPDVASMEWAGWGAVEQSIKSLMGSQKRTVPGPMAGPGPEAGPIYYPPPHNPLKRVQLAADGPVMSPPKPAPTSSNTSRISIANII